LNCQAGETTPIEGFEKRTEPVGIGIGAKPSGHVRAEIAIEHQRLSELQMGSGSRQDYAELSPQEMFNTDCKRRV